MSRLFAILAGSVVLLSTGVVHGLWTDRWHKSEAVRQAVDRLSALPDDLGPWKGRAYEQDPAMLTLAGAAGHFSRSFIDPRTGESVLVILLAGKPARMAVHRPEHCYQAAGYEMEGTAAQARLSGDGIEPAEFFTALFTRDEAAGPSRLRIFWSFSAGGPWEAPASPRTYFARRPILYKLYVIRNVAGSPGPPQEDPGTRLLGRLLPVLTRTLTTGP